MSDGGRDEPDGGLAESDRAAEPPRNEREAERTGNDLDALDAATEGRYERIDPDEWDDVWIVGDVHGCIGELRQLLDRLDPGPDDLVAFVGDLVRKGPDSAAVCDLVRRRPNFRSVRGNNEGKLLRGEASLPALSDDDAASLADLPVAMAIGDALVVHGGIDHRKPLAEHTVAELLTNRSLVPGGSYDRPYWFERRTEAPRVYFGHTVMAEPLVSPWAVGLDTGCVYGGQLTAIEHGTDRIVTVEPAETYQSRGRDGIVEPRPPRVESSG